MKRKYVLLTVVIVALAASAVLAGFIFSGGGRTYSDLDDLRARFNQDKGKVRLLLLLSPT